MSDSNEDSAGHLQDDFEDHLRRLSRLHRRLVDTVSQLHRLYRRKRIRVEICAGCPAQSPRFQWGCPTSWTIQTTGKHLPSKIGVHSQEVVGPFDLFINSWHLAIEADLHAAPPCLRMQNFSRDDPFRRLIPIDAPIDVPSPLLFLCFLNDPSDREPHIRWVFDDLVKALRESIDQLHFAYVAASSVSMCAYFACVEDRSSDVDWEAPMISWATPIRDIFAVIHRLRQSLEEGGDGSDDDRYRLPAGRVDPLAAKAWSMVQPLLPADVFWPPPIGLAIQAYQDWLKDLQLVCRSVLLDPPVFSPCIMMHGDPNSDAFDLSRRQFQAFFNETFDKELTMRLDRFEQLGTTESVDRYFEIRESLNTIKSDIARKSLAFLLNCGGTANTRDIAEAAGSSQNDAEAFTKDIAYKCLKKHLRTLRPGWRIRSRNKYGVWVLDPLLE